MNKKEAAKKLGLNQKGLADLLGLSASHLSTIKELSSIHLIVIDGALAIKELNNSIARVDELESECKKHLETINKITRALDN